MQLSLMDQLLVDVPHFWDVGVVVVAAVLQI